MRDYTSLAKQVADKTAAETRYHNSRTEEAKNYQEQANAILAQFVGLPCNGGYVLAMSEHTYDPGLVAIDLQKRRTRISISCTFDRVADHINITAHVYHPYSHGYETIAAPKHTVPDVALDEVAQAVADYLGKRYLKAGAK